MEPVYTVEEVAIRLQVSQITVRRLVKARHLHRLPGLRALRIPSWSVEDYIADDGRARSVRMARHGHSTREMDRRYGGASEVADIAAADGLEEAIG